jgi:excisionase family DNA binding protein
MLCSTDSFCQQPHKNLQNSQILLYLVYYFKVIYNTSKYIFIIYITEEVSMERLMTTEEVAELLRIDVGTVRRLILRGELPAYRIAGEYRFTRADLEKFLESQRVVANPPGPNHPMAKFTERSRKVLTLASEEARRYNHADAGTEHLLLAIMSEGGGVGAKTLGRLQVQPDEVRAQIETLRPMGEEPVGEGMIGMTTQGKESIELAVQEARSLGHHYIGTEHLLLGLLREEEDIASQVLRKSGVTLEEARKLIKQILAEEQTTSAPELEQHEK